MPLVTVPTSQIGFLEFQAFYVRQAFKSSFREMGLILAVVLSLLITRRQTMTAPVIFVFAIAVTLGTAGAYAFRLFMAKREARRLYKVSPGLQHEASIVFQEHHISISSDLLNINAPWNTVKYFIAAERIFAFSTGANFNLYLAIAPDKSVKDVVKLFESKGIRRK